MLKIGDFKRIGESGAPSRHYFEHVLPDGRSVCLESCMGGYCVAVYDEHKNIIGDKKCTSLNNFMEASIAPGLSLLAGKALDKAVLIANQKV